MRNVNLFCSAVERLLMSEMTYVHRIRNLREDHDYTQEYVARKLGTSQTMYARYERAANALPIHHLLTLCQLYRVSADYILGLTDRPEPYPNRKRST